MIWHDETILIDDVCLRIVGELSKRHINIVATINTLDGRHSTKTIFNKLINSKLSYDEPSNDDIELAFGQKIDKFKHNLSRNDLLRRFGIVESLSNTDIPPDFQGARKPQKSEQDGA